MASMMDYTSIPVVKDVLGGEESKEEASTTKPAAGEADGSHSTPGAAHGYRSSHHDHPLVKTPASSSWTCMACGVDSARSASGHFGCIHGGHDAAVDICGRCVYAGPRRAAAVLRVAEHAPYR